MFEALAELMPTFEGNVPHMYLDTKGNVTVGVGHLLAHVSDAYGLPFLLPNGLPAELHDILNDYQAIRQSQPGKLPRYYAGIADLRLSADSVDKLLVSDINRTAGGVEAYLPLMQQYPAPAKDALVNMAFQLGAHGLNYGYPKLMTACREKDWQAAAAECFIPDAQPSRNEANKNFFLSILKQGN